MQKGPPPLRKNLELSDQERAELVRSIAVLCEKALGVGHLRKDQELFALGWDQPLGKRLLEQIGKRFQVKLDPGILRDSLTISKLADLVQLKQADADRLCLVPIRSQGSKAPIFLVHGVGGNVLGFFNLAKKLPADFPVYGIQAQSLYADGPALIHLTDMAACYLREVRRVQPVGPYHFVGFSFGGLVAYEMALQLRQQGEEVELVGMLDTWQPSYMNLPALKGFGPSHAFAGIAKLYSHTRDLSLLSKFIFAGIKIRNRLFRLFYRYSVGRGQVSMAQHMKNVRELNKMAGIQYQVKPYDGKITLLRAEDELDNGLPLDLGWNAFARAGVDIHFFPGDHGQVLAEPNVSVVGDILSRCLARSGQRERLVI